MRITQEGDYALRVVLYFCKLGIGERIEAREISKNNNIPLGPEGLEVRRFN